MRLTGYILLLFSISLVLYYLGYGPIINIFTERGAQPLSITCETGETFCTDSTVVLGAIIAVTLGASVLVTLVAGFSAIYIVPLLLLIALLNFVMFPFDFIMSAPEAISIPILTLFNILTVLAVLNFVRGGA